MSWLLTVNQLANDLQEKKTRDLQKQRNSEMSSLRGKLLMIFGDDAADIIDNGQADIERVAYRHANFEFRNVGGLCGPSIYMSFYVMVGGTEERIEYNSYVEDLEDASKAYVYLHEKAKNRIDRHYEMLNRKEQARKQEPEVSPTLTTLEVQTVKRLRSVAKYVSFSGDHPTNGVDEAIYAFAQALVSIELVTLSVDTSYDDGSSTDGEDDIEF